MWGNVIGKIEIGKSNETMQEKKKDCAKHNSNENSRNLSSKESGKNKNNQN